MQTIQGLATVFVVILCILLVGALVLWFIFAPSKLVPALTAVAIIAAIMAYNGRLIAAGSLVGVAIVLTILYVFLREHRSTPSRTHNC